MGQNILSGLLLFCLLLGAASCTTQTGKEDQSRAVKSLNITASERQRIAQLKERGWKHIDHILYDEAEKTADSITSLANQIGDKAALGEAIMLHGRIAFLEGDVKRALELGQDALALFKLEGSADQEAEALRAMGEANERLGHYEEAIDNYRTIFTIIDEKTNKSSLASAYNGLGVVFFRMGNYPEAQENYFSALKLFESSQKAGSVASVKSNIGLIYNRMGDKEKARSYLWQAIAEGRSAGDQLVVAKASASLGSLYTHKGSFDSAFTYQLAALEIYSRLKSPTLLLEIHQSLGVTCFESQKYDEALDHFEKVAQLSRETGNMIYLNASYSSIGNIYSTQGDMEEGEKAKALYHKALDYQLESIAIADSIGAKEMLASAYDAITFTYKGLGDLEKALDYTDRMVVLKDSLRNNNTDRQLEEIRTQYEIDKAVVAEKSKRVLQNELAAISLGGLLCIGLLIYLLQRQKNLRKKERERADHMYQLAELELQSLRSQLNPHFMFNSLNAIQDLILRHENEKSHIYLSNFSSLLRMLLENADSPLVALSKEMEFLQAYILMEKLRLPDLMYVVNMPSDIQTSAVMIPNMILQPHVENAIWHGLSYKPPGDRKIEISIVPSGDHITIHIEDNGIGRARSQEIKNSLRKAHRSKGMELLKRRFSLIKMQFDIDITEKTEDINVEGQVAGTRVTIVIPVSFAHGLKPVPV